MWRKSNMRWAALVAVNTALWCVLGFYGSITAAPQRGQPPFANAVEQRAEIVRQLQDMNALLKEQNALLRSGKIHVTVTHSAELEAP